MQLDIVMPYITIRLRKQNGRTTGMAKIDYNNTQSYNWRLNSSMKE